MVISVALAVLALTGCGGAPRVETTFLTSVDLVEMTDGMARSLALNEQVSDRNGAGNPWVISMNRVVNHTNQIIPEREKWLYVGRLRAVLGATEFAREHNIIWIMPVRRWALVQEELGPMPDDLRLNPTHELTAEFSALTDTSGRGRSDAYLCEYELIDLATGGMVWSDHWEVKRALGGLTYD